jgi:alginate O-acetyltransferase complex protein AlgJ
MSGSWNSDIAEGIRLARQDPARGLEKLEAGLLVSPASADGHFARGEALQKLGRYDEAESAIRQALALCSDDPRFHHGLAAVLQRTGQWGASLGPARIAVESEPGNALYHSTLAQAAWRSGNLEEAEREARTAVSLEPGNAHLRGLMGSFLIEKSQADEAEAHAKRACELAPEHAAFHHLLSRVLARQKRLQEAVAESERAIGLNSKDGHYHLHLALVLTESGDLDGARAAMREAVALLPGNAHLHSQYGHLLARLGFNEEARNEFSAAARLAPEEAMFRRFLSGACSRLEQYEEAIAAVREAIRLQPGQASDFARLGELYALQDKFVEAAAAYEQAVSLEPGNQHYTARLDALRAVPAVTTQADRDSQKAQVVEGQDGWLFHKIDGVFEQVCDGRGFSDRDHARLLSLWEARQAWCQARGMEYRVLIVPERHVLYEDKLPAGITMDENRPALRLIRAADELFRSALIYPVAAIRRGRTVREVCYKSDVHWTTWGAYLAYRELMESLPACRTRIVPESALALRASTRLGDMMLWLERRDREDVLMCDAPAVEVNEVFTTRTFKVGQVDVYETAKRELPTLVLFRTSNSTYLLPLLHHHFSRIVAVASTAVHYDLLRSERPDVVISEVSERYIAAPDAARGGGAIRFPSDFEGLSFAEFTGAELPLPKSASADDGRVRPGHKESAGEGEEISDLERIARGMCVRDGLPETQWHFYVGRALGVVAAQAG